MKNIFLYPKLDKLIGTPNPYIFNFQTSLAKKCRIVNAQAPNRGILSFFLFFFPTRIFILNWIEFLPEKRFGKVQVLGFVICSLFIRLFGKKIIWILHNKGSHHTGINPMTNFMFRLLMGRSDKIITHSDTGLEFVKSNYPAYSSKVEVVIHPIGDLFPQNPGKEKQYDFLIWGTLFPYKGVDKFLKYVKEQPLAKNYKILLVGKCFNPEYKKYLESFLSENITFDDNLYELEKIVEFSAISRYILFTYNSKTVISSGALMDSIRMGTAIIGPNHGAFKDLSHYSFIKTYNSFEGIFEIHGEEPPDKIEENKERKRFFEENNWDVFIQKLERIFKEI